MADPLSVVSGIVSILSLTTQISLKFRAYQRATISQSYGGTTGLLMTTFFGNTASEYERLQRVILRGSDDEALRFRDSVINECNMTAIAGAIIAQVALTALSLADLSLAHWTARAFLLFATVAGCISVYYACALSRDIGKSYQPELIHDWLSTAPPDGLEEAGIGEIQERKASISAVFILSAPYTMMSYAIFAFIVGLAIYQGFVWTRNLDTDAGKLNSRNVFIAYIVSTGICELFFAFAGWIKAIEELLLHDGIRTRLIELLRATPIDRRRDDDRHPRLQEHPSDASAKTTVAPSQIFHTATQSQDTTNIISSSSIAAALEAAARAHMLSAEADRRVAAEFAKLSRHD